MTGKRIVFLSSVSLIAGLTFFGLPLNNRVELEPLSLTQQMTATSTVKTWITDCLGQKEVLASPYRRSVRRTARRTSRRTSRRHGSGGGDYYDTPYYGGGTAVATGTVVAVSTLAAGSIVNTLPSACGTVVVNGFVYYNCAGTFYVPSGNRWVVVNAP